MAREIKLRGWHKEEKKFEYFELSNFFERLFYTADYRYEDYDFSEFTSITDSNGLEIYEGDIVECVYARSIYDEQGSEHTTEETYKDSVEFFDGAFGTALSGNPLARGHEMRYPADSHMVSIKVIGNIYENPGLLAK